MRDLGAAARIVDEWYRSVGSTLPTLVHFYTTRNRYSSKVVHMYSIASVYELTMLWCASIARLGPRVDGSLTAIAPELWQWCRAKPTTTLGMYRHLRDRD